jgi:putative sugar O-methyltransferase
LKCKKATNWIFKYGFDDFRGINNPIGTSYADNIRIDNRYEFGLGLKSKIANKISRLPLVKKVFDSQIKITRVYINHINDLKSLIYRKSDKVKYLLKNYIVKDTVNFGSISTFKINDSEYAFWYLDILNLIDLINNKINLKKIHSFFEIGGGFGSNIHLLLNNFKNIKKILYLDVAPNLFIGTEYLRTFFGDAIKDYLELKNKKITFSNDENLEILCIAPWQLPHVDLQIDHFHNSCSFQEMSLEIIENYSKFINKILNKNGSLTINSNRPHGSKYVSQDDLLNIFNLPFDHEEYKVLCHIDGLDFNDLYYFQNKLDHLLK